MVKSRVFFVLMTSLTLGMVISFPAFPGKLVVGTKVIYPGGADQPPKEKDTGISWKAGDEGGSSASAMGGGGSRASLQYQSMLDGGDLDALFREVENRYDPISSYYRVMTLQEMGREEEAASEASRLLRSEHFPPDLKAKIQDSMELSPGAAPPTGTEIPAESEGEQETEPDFEDSHGSDL